MSWESKSLPPTSHVSVFVLLRCEMRELGRITSVPLALSAFLALDLGWEAGGEGQGRVDLFSAPPSDLVPIECTLPRNKAMPSV